MDLPVAQLPGVGWTLDKKLGELKIKKVADVRASGRAYLQRELGDKTGEQLWKSAHGRDDRPVEPIQPRKWVLSSVHTNPPLPMSRKPDQRVQMTPGVIVGMSAVGPCAAKVLVA